MQFKGQVAIVTGGSTGIGRAVAEQLAARGASVLIGYFGELADAEMTVRDIEASGGVASAFYADITKVEEIKKMFAACIERYGKPDMLIANAGFSGMLPLMEITEQEYYSKFEVNTKGTLFCVQEAGRHLNKDGRIVVVSSSSVSFPCENMTAYTASKSALHAIVQIAAKELGPRGITVNSILPGVTATENAMKGLPPELIKAVTETTPSKKVGTPDDVAQAIVLLLMKEAHWINGQNILANGGGMF